MVLKSYKQIVKAVERTAYNQVVGKGGNPISHGLESLLGERLNLENNRTKLFKKL
jgi:hypothetical protein